MCPSSATASSAPRGGGDWPPRDRRRSSISRSRSAGPRASSPRRWRSTSRRVASWRKPACGLSAASTRTGRSPWRAPSSATSNTPSTGRRDNALLGVLGGPGLAHDRDADLPGIGQLFLDLLGDVTRDHLRGDVVDLFRLDHHPDLATGLHGEHLLHAWLLARDLLDALEPLDVVLQRLTARARPPTTDAVSSLRQHRLDRAHHDLVVVRLDRMYDVLVLAVLAGDLRADDGVAALDLVGERLADVVQHGASLHQHRVEPELARHHPGDVRRLDQMLEDVLAVRRPVAQLSEQRDELGMHVGQTDLDDRVLTSADAELLDLGLAALVDLFDPVRMDAAVENQPLQSQPAHFAEYRIEAGEQHRFRGVVDDQVDAGRRLKGADVAALTADDAALHVIAGKVQH